MAAIITIYMIVFQLLIRLGKLAKEWYLRHYSGSTSMTFTVKRNPA
jgi:hypothetical protein